MAEERPPGSAEEVGSGVDLPAHNAFETCPKCGVKMIEHHRVRYHEDMVPLNAGRAQENQEMCTRLGIVGEHLCHLCDVCGYGWVSQVAEPVE